MARKSAAVSMDPCWATLPAELKARIANFSVAAHVRAHVVETPDRPVKYEVFAANVEDRNTINAFVNVKFFREAILDTISARTMLHIEVMCSFQRTQAMRSRLTLSTADVGGTATPDYAADSPRRHLRHASQLTTSSHRVSRP